MSISAPVRARLVLGSARRHARKTLATGGLVCLGTALLVFMHAFTVGINDTMVDNTTALHYGHAYLELDPAADIDLAAHEVAENELVSMVLPRTVMYGALARGSSIVPVRIYGVDPSKERAMTAVPRRILEGEYPDHGAQVLLGAWQAKELDVSPGDVVKFYQGPESGGARLTVTGVFETGVPLLDGGVAYMPREAASSLVPQGAEVAVFFRRGVDVPEGIEEIGLDGLRPWQEQMPDLAQLVELNEFSSLVIMLLVYLMMGLAVAFIFSFSVLERTREFGIMKAIGMTPADLEVHAFMESALVCAVGAAAGMVLGAALAAAASAIGFDISHFTSSNRYFVVSSVIYPRLSADAFVWPGLMALVLAVLSSWLPARGIGRRLAAETMRSA